MTAEEFTKYCHHVVFKAVMGGYEICNKNSHKNKSVFIPEDDLFSRDDRIIVRYDDYVYWFKPVKPATEIYQIECVKSAWEM